MKKLLLAMMLFACMQLDAQVVKVLLKEAQNLEWSLKEDASLEKYKQVLAIDKDNLEALLRATELSSSVGGRQADKNVKATYFNQAKEYADRALVIDANSADANYVRALAARKLWEIETENKKIVAHVKDVKIYADKAIAINPDHARANYIEGKWHFEMVSLPWVKRAAVKVLFTGVPDAKIEDAFKYMERCRVLDKYFVLNYLDLAKAYKFDNKPQKAIEILNLLVKLPNRTADDAALKAEGKTMLSEMQ